MSVQSLLKGGTAAFVLASTLAITSAAADTYNDYPRHHTYRHHSYRSEESTRRSEESDRNMSDRSEMQSRNMPAAMQMPLIQVRDMGKVKSASVRDENGNSVGTVKDVVLARDGEPSAVRVNVGGFWGMGGKTVTIDARDLLYERDRNELTADLSKHEIDGMKSRS